MLLEKYGILVGTYEHHTAIKYENVGTTLAWTMSLQNNIIKR